MSGNARPYRGRFAPSPTGPLHFGSLVAAVASYAQALANSGEWLVRIEDIDPPREMPGAADAIVDSLHAHGFEFDPPEYQSSRLAVYDQVIDDLVAAGAAYPCSCSRKMLLKTAQPGHAGLIYPGTCRNGADTRSRPATAVRLRTDNAVVSFQDRLQGPQSCAIGAEIGDFLLRRGDGLAAYQTAVAVDDAAQGITEVVRGTDLLDATFMQLHLLTLLGQSHPQYAHFPVVTGTDGRKLAKQRNAPAIDNKNNKNNILQALSFLLQKPPKTLETASLSDIWAWTAQNWDFSPLCGLLSLPERSIMVR